MDSKKQPRLRTFEDVFHRMRWDDKYTMDDMTMGYEDRLLGAMEMPLCDFVPIAEGGELPMHRVWYIRCAADVLWDRRRKLDLIFSSGLTSVILAAGAGALADEETAQRINEALANLEMLGEQRQHTLDVQSHIQRHAAARAAGTLPCQQESVSKSHASPILEMSSDTCGTSARRVLTSALFRVCDVDGDGFLSMDEMRVFANSTGFDGDEEEWAEEFRLICSEHCVKAEVGLDVSLFEMLVNDASESGCHCTDQELQEIAADLRQKSESAAKAFATGTTGRETGTLACDRTSFPMSLS